MKVVVFCLIAALWLLHTVFSLLRVWIVDRALVSQEINLRLPEITSSTECMLSTNSYLAENNEQLAKTPVQNATFLIVASNAELHSVLATMRSVEDHFNRNYHYPWSFLNDVPFTDDFISSTMAMASGPVHYGVATKGQWEVPQWVNRTRMEEQMKKLDSNDVLFANSTYFRNKNRFTSGFMFRHSLLKKFDYYMRVAPGATYTCDIVHDPFYNLHTRNYTFGFSITAYENEETVDTIWKSASDFFGLNPQYLHQNNLYGFFTDTGHVGEQADQICQNKGGYNTCAFVSEFEVGDLNFFRSKEYQEYFDSLDATGGFYYERWSDSAVHSIGVGLMVDSNKIYHYEEWGFDHGSNFRCTRSVGFFLARRCVCTLREFDIDYSSFTCLPKWWKHHGKQFIR